MECYKKDNCYEIKKEIFLVIKKIFILVFITFFNCLLYATQKTSPNYAITWDVYDCGGEKSGTVSFSFFNSIGQGTTGNLQSASYDLNSGYYVYYDVASGESFTPTPTPTPLPDLSWWESNRPVNPEMPYETNKNDTFSQAAQIPIKQQGGGFISTYDKISKTSDVDDFIFTIPALENYENHDILKVSLYIPEGAYNYAISLYEENGANNWNFIGYADARGGNTAVAYANIDKYHGVDHNFIAQVKSNYLASDKDFYILKVEVVGSGFISGFVDLVGVKTSGKSNVEIRAYSYGSSVGRTITASDGSYIVKVPINVPVDYLFGVRNWYPGCPEDWAYGMTYYHPVSPIALNSPGQLISGNNFEIYKEGVLSGNINALKFVDMYVMIPYEHTVIAMLENTKNAYAIHNLMPGTFDIWVVPSDRAGQEVSFTANVNIRDGFETVLNYNLGTGYTVSGTLNPAPLSVSETVEVQVFQSGNSFTDYDLFRDYYSVPVSGNSYNIKNLPYGIYNFRVSSISMWYPQKNILVNSNKNINFTGPAPITFVSGTIIDDTGTFNLSNLSVYCFVSGTSDIIKNDVLMWVGKVNASGQFTIYVPDIYNYYDIIVNLPKGDGPGVTLGWAYDVPKASTTTVIKIEPGIKITGNVLFNSKPISVFSQYSILEFDRNIGSFRYYDLVGDVNGFYNSSQYLKISPSAYPVRIRANSTYFNETEATVFVSNSDVLQDINLTLNFAKDNIKPYSGYLKPEHKGILLHPDDYLQVLISDYALGTGFNDIQILSDGCACSVEDLSYTTVDDKTRLYTFRLPQSVRQPGVTRLISIYAQDNNSNIYSTGYSWQVTIATPTPICDLYGNTKIGSFKTIVNQNEINASRYYLSTGEINSIYVYISTTSSGNLKAAIYSDNAGNPNLLLGQTNEIIGNLYEGWNQLNMSPSPINITVPGYYWIAFKTNSSSLFTYDTTGQSVKAITGGYLEPWPDPYPAATVSNYAWSVYVPVCTQATATPTNTPTVSRTNTNIPTQSKTPSNTVTQSLTNTITQTITRTITSTLTQTISETITQTITKTVTQTMTETITNTVSLTNTQTNTETITATFTKTITETTTPTISQTITQSITQTITQTTTKTITQTISPTITQTVTPTITDTITETITPTITETSTDTFTETPTNSHTNTATFTFTNTPTDTNTKTSTNTATNTATYTETFTVTYTGTDTATNTFTNTPTDTYTYTATYTATNTNTQTNTATNTPTLTSTNTATTTNTKTNTGTNTETYTITDTSTATKTLTFTETNTPTNTATNSPSPSATASPTDTATDTATPTATNTDTATNTATNTATYTETFTVTYTVTNTETPTFTNTFTETQTWTQTNTPTNTYTPTYTFTVTNTPTDTETYTPSHTFTITETPTITDTPTITPTPTNTATPAINIVLDRNYIDVSKEQKVKISIKEKAGKKVYIKIYSLAGDFIRKLEYTTQQDGWNSIEWDAKNAVGKIVGRGIYFLYIKVDGISEEIKRIYIVK